MELLKGGISLALDFVPVVGNIKGIIEGVTGKDLITGEEMNAGERTLSLAASIPVGQILKFGKALKIGRGVTKGVTNGVKNGRRISKFVKNVDNGVLAFRLMEQLGVKHGKVITHACRIGKWVERADTAYNTSSYGKDVYDTLFN